MSLSSERWRLLLVLSGAKTSPILQWRGARPNVTHEYAIVTGGARQFVILSRVMRRKCPMKEISGPR
ncbi:hypothetical protein DMENIID0001_079500 [Sergentomyia squamirostris]